MTKPTTSVLFTRGYADAYEYRVAMEAAERAVRDMLRAQRAGEAIRRFQSRPWYVRWFWWVWSW